MSRWRRITTLSILVRNYLVHSIVLSMTVPNTTSNVAKNNPVQKFYPLPHFYLISCYRAGSLLEISMAISPPHAFYTKKTPQSSISISVIHYTVAGRVILNCYMGILNRHWHRRRETGRIKFHLPCPTVTPSTTPPAIPSPLKSSFPKARLICHGMCHLISNQFPLQPSQHIKIPLAGPN